VSAAGGRLVSGVTLSGRTAVVTGAAGTMGLAVVRALLEDGAKVALVDLDAARLDEVDTELPPLAGSTVHVACDIRDAAAVAAAHQRIEAELGPVDILVNNAGVLSNSKAAQTTGG